MVLCAGRGRAGASVAERDGGRRELGRVARGVSAPGLALVARLRELYGRAGWGSPKECARETGRRPRTVARYLSGEALPPLAFVEELLAAASVRAGHPGDEGKRRETRRLYYAGLHDVARRPHGPWDISEVDDPWDERLDLGALFVAGYEPGTELTVDVAGEDGVPRCVAATVEMLDAAAGLRLQAYAADAEDGSWEQVRERIAEGLDVSGASPRGGVGPLGVELSALVPDAGVPGGNAIVRFAGCDGPGWLLRGTFTGAGALPGHRCARRLESVFRATVVAPGHTPRLPGDPLYLTMPRSPS